MTPAIRMLVSVRDVDEARDAAAAGVDFIDLKEPRAGALGGLPPDTLRAICTTLRSGAGHHLISATIGDLPLEPHADALPSSPPVGALASSAATDVATPEATDLVIHAPALARIDTVAACGVDLVKVGVSGTGPRALTLLAALARHATTTGLAIVPVLLADDGLAPEVVAAACNPVFSAIMCDTQRKRAGSLFDLVPAQALAHFIAQGRRRGLTVGLAGALRHADIPRLAQLAPDFAGFRSAVCIGHREDRLDPQAVRHLREALYRPQACVAPTT
ncbi:MAG: (5-formylfuran-3-yl)methyl phosphate synthase [Rhodocyclaceae bacterium]